MKRKIVSCARCHQSHRKCVPEEERPCPNCVKLGIFCEFRGSRRGKPENKKKTSECEKCNVVFSSNIGFCEECGQKLDSNLVNQKQLSSENRDLRRQIMALRKCIDNNLSGASSLADHGKWWAIVKVQSSLNVSLPRDILLCKISAHMRTFFLKKDLEGENLAVLMQRSTIPIPASMLSFEDLTNGNEETVDFRMVGPMPTKLGLYGTERICHVYMKHGKPYFTFAVIKKIWKLNDEKELFDLFSVKPQKLGSKMRTQAEPLSSQKTEEELRFEFDVFSQQLGGDLFDEEELNNFKEFFNSEMVSNIQEEK